MKHIFKFMFFSSVLATMLLSCAKDENKVLFTGGTAPVLTPSSTNALVLVIGDKDKPALNLTWTNPNYNFNTGVSSQEVTYTLQFDTTGANFSSPKKGEKSISKDLSVKLTVRDLNTVLLGMGLAENIPHDIEIRVKSAMANSSGALYSNVVKIKVTPYLDVVYPVPAELYITGSATPLSWQCGCATDVGTTQKFTKVNSSKFEITIPLSANNSYLLLPVYGSWSAKYGFTGANNTNNVNGDTFKPEGGDIKAPAVSKTYKITVDFKTGKFTVE